MKQRFKMVQLTAKMFNWLAFLIFEKNFKYYTVRMIQKINNLGIDILPNP
jgi:hypothetical protein